MLCLSLILSNQLLLTTASHAQSCNANAPENLIGSWIGGELDTYSVLPGSSNECLDLVSTAVYARSKIQIKKLKHRSARVKLFLPKAGSFVATAKLSENALFFSNSKLNQSVGFDMHMDSTNKDLAYYTLTHTKEVYFKNKKVTCKIFQSGSFFKVH